ncbi:DUF4065 domain-containing protein [Halobaculum lipolyticum]|uniref:DUF4065 domain-containing protein n=1 Tax=Halobaculum lipolyticum TaxID=3032001 RepID=A0ABD5WEQ9_9EURY
MGRIDTIDRRTDVVLLLFGYQSEIHGVTRLQKLLFLIEQETEFFQQYGEAVAFEFAPYKMGPFSEHVYEEIEFLDALGAITTDSTGDRRLFTLTPKGEKIAAEVESQLEPPYREELRELVDAYGELPLTELLEYVYSEYPTYTTESEIIEDLDVRS